MFKFVPCYTCICIKEVIGVLISLIQKGHVLLLLSWFKMISPLFLISLQCKSLFALEEVLYRQVEACS